MHGVPLRLGETEQYAAVVTSAHLPQERWEYYTPMRATLYVLERVQGRAVARARTVLPFEPRTELPDDPERMPTRLAILTWRAEDVDDDGHLELVMVADYVRAVVCGPGPVSARRLLIVNLGDFPTIAFSEALEHYYVRDGSVRISELRGHATHEDVNGDRHRDVRVRFRDCGRGERGDECGPSRDVDFVYQGATDTFVRATPAPRERDCGAE